ncbi:hypothetical protein ABZY90_30460 [Streptomyces sp. NPDC006422]|uniref:hypothetical protein n=1 Tax=unclassified Streptomyces TaxID=2593676 RepID=UPI0033BEB19D
MGTWFTREIVDQGQLPLFCLLVAFIATFGFIRFSVRMIRAQVRWWPGNVTPGGLHIHHVVFGVGFMLLGGVGLVAVRSPSLTVQSVLAVLFGVGAALVLDEFALILHLRDVYWQREGRASVEAIFVAVAAISLMLLGFRPAPLITAGREVGDGTALAVTVVCWLLQASLAVVTLLKGKLWTGLFGVFVNVFLVVGAIRLARPNSPWGRSRYAPGSRKDVAARRREARWWTPVNRKKVALQELLAGKHNQAPEEPPRAADREPR